MAHIIKSDGTQIPHNDLSLEGLQAAVGGYIEIIRLHTGGAIIVNDEGLIKKLPVNLDVSCALNTCIVGDVVVLSENEYNKIK